jgi:hypothetical protein
MRQLPVVQGQSGGPARVEVRIDHNYHQLPTDKLTRWEATRAPAYFEYRRRWNENPKNFVVGDFPIHLDVEATSDCNLKCTMCPRTEMIDQNQFW